MRGDGMMLTDAQRRDFLALLFDWLNQEPRGVGPGPQPRPDDYALTLYAEGTRDHWCLRCHFELLLDPFGGYDRDFCVNLLEVPDVFDWIDSEYLLRQAQVGDEERIENLFNEWLGLFDAYLAEGGLFDDGTIDHKIPCDDHGC